MEDFNAIVDSYLTQDGMSPFQNVCFECGCYKGKPCAGGTSAIVEASETSIVTKEVTTVETTPKTSNNIIPFVCFR